MGTHELESKIRELRQLQALIEEATAEAETIKDTIKAASKGQWGAVICRPPIPSLNTLNTLNWEEAT